MKSLLFVYGWLLFTLSACTAQTQKQTTLPDLPVTQGSNETVSYAEGIAFLEKLAAASPYINLDTVGTTDAGFPLHTAVFSAKSDFSPQKIQENGDYVLFINNAIHPGEPDGIEASFQLLHELCTDKKLRKELEDVVLVVIPFYNIGGALNRRHYTRVNQNGPHEMGFRGNARNFDLNRDFIKADSRNVRAFYRIFHRWQPDFFVDTHVSNGADYQYTLTLLGTQADKLSAPLGDYFKNEFMPKLQAELLEKYDEPTTPYVNAWGTTPEKGFPQFMDLPRYSSGYAGLFHVPSIVPELHMLKPYPRRVEAMYRFLKTTSLMMATEGKTLRENAQKARKLEQNASTFHFDWNLDDNRADTVTFLGYAAEFRPSPVTKREQLYYNQEKPYQKQIPFFAYYKATRNTQKPKAFIVPQSQYKVLELLRMNNIQMERITEDSEKELTTYYIDKFETRNSPYEGHYLHYNTEVREETQTVQLRAGDYRVTTDQPHVRYVMETLWPEAEDSFFNWNYFDAILQEKEGFSSYVFDPMATQILEENPDLAAALEQKRAEDEVFRGSAYQQLKFIYDRSPYAEPEYRRYPIFGEK
ncbi:MAG: M14 family metallopeptidase [Bacteroidota bacterium]